MRWLMYCAVPLFSLVFFLAFFFMGVGHELHQDLVSDPTRTHPFNKLKGLLSAAMTTTTHIVGSGEGASFATIGDALRSASCGDVVHVQPGIYEELVRVTTDVTIEALTAPTEEEGTETIITNGVVIMANATMRQLQIRGQVDIRKGHAVIESCEVHHGADGVRVGPKSKLTMRTTRVHHCSGGGDGVYFMNDSSGQVEDCDIYECRVNGVRVDHAAVVLRGSRIRDCQFGVYYRRNSTGLVEENAIEHAGKIGVYVVEGSDPVVRGNHVRECGVLCALVSQEGKGLWTDNTFDGSIHVTAGADAKLGENRISGFKDVELIVPPAAVATL